MFNLLLSFGLTAKVFTIILEDDVKLHVMM